MPATIHYRKDAIHNCAPVVVLAQTSSTNDEALVLARQGAAHMTCVLAESMTRGRGRQGKEWICYPNCSIAASFVIRLAGCETLPLLASVAVCEAIRETSGLDATIKWPNDILINGNKVCGILTEASGTGEERFYILGIGLNVNVPQEGISVDFPGTMLEVELGRPLEREAILNDIIRLLEKYFNLYRQQGWQAIAPTYQDLCGTLGQPVHWQAGEAKLEGVAEKLTQQGALLIREESGVIHEIHVGEIIAQGREHV